MRNRDSLSPLAWVRAWAGFALGIAALVSYPTFFARYAITRDFPWLTLLLMALGLFLVASGFLRAFRQPDAYRSNGTNGLSRSDIK